ncbi:MAG: hypothetical protein J6M14_04295 [Campylobacter sp.]|nr:hypothetical protein [Campylobacter sp.]
MFNYLKNLPFEIDKLFEKYNSNVKKGTNLFRGLNLTQDKFDKLGLKVGEIISINNNPNLYTSFSTNFRQAKYFAKNKYLDKRIIFITKAIGKELNIEQLSTIDNEKEHLIKRGKMAKIKQIKELKDKDGKKWLIVKIEQIE